MMNFKLRRTKLQEQMKKEGYELVVLTDPSYIQYFTGLHGNLGIDWGRPGIMIITCEGEPTLIIPNMEEEMGHMQTGLDEIYVWADGLDGEWGKHLAPVLDKYKNTTIGIDHFLMPRVVWDFIVEKVGTQKLSDVSPVVNRLRMIKDADEIQIVKHAGQVATTMLQAIVDNAKIGMREYEVSLIAREAGTRKAAEFMEKYYQEYEPFNYPCISFQQIMASGKQTRMCHHRTSMTKLVNGEPLFTCFCGTTSFMDYHLGFDRTLFVGEINDTVAKLLETAERAQKAALAVVKPGATCEQVFEAYAAVITGDGFPIPFRAGRSQGIAANETPQLARGDKTVIQPGMCFAVDGGANGEYRVQVGDSIIVTEDGFEYLTKFTNDHEKLIVGK